MLPTTRRITWLAATAVLGLGLALGATAPAAAADDAATEKGDEAEVLSDVPEWVTAALEKVKTLQGAQRQKVLDELVEKDEGGNALNPLIALLPELEEEGAQLAVVKTLGRDGLVAAAEPIHPFLDEKSIALRAYAAVSLEYIGSPESVKPLSKRMNKEKDEAVQNHIARALGRCGKEDSGARSALLKLAGRGKTDTQGLGAIVGLAYFEGDAKAARGIEKLMNKIGPPTFGRRGDWGSGTFRRALLSWALAEIQDPKSSAFVEKKMLKPIRNAQSPFVQPVMDFYENVVSACDGDAEALAAVENGVRMSAGRSEGGALQDGAREDRDNTTFTPKGEWDAGGGGEGGDRGPPGRGGGRGN